MEAYHGWEDSVKLGASELAGALGYHPHVSPWYYLKRESSYKPSPSVVAEETKPTDACPMPDNWWHPCQKEARRRACEFPIEDPDFCEALREARLCREEGREPRQAMERMQILLDRCVALDESIKSTVLACARSDIQCAWGKRQEKLAASDYAEWFVEPQDRSKLVGDCYGKPALLSRRIATASFGGSVSSSTRGCELGGVVHLELRGQPDGGIEGGDLVLEFKSRTRPPPNCSWPKNPPLYDAVQCVAYSWLWPTNPGKSARVVLVERRPSSIPGGFDLVCTNPVTKQLERTVAARCETFLRLVACARRKPGFMKNLETLQDAERDLALRQYFRRADPPTDNNVHT